MTLHPWGNLSASESGPKIFRLHRGASTLTGQTCAIPHKEASHSYLVTSSQHFKAVLDCWNLSISQQAPDVTILHVAVRSRRWSVLSRVERERGGATACLAMTRCEYQLKTEPLKPCSRSTAGTPGVFGPMSL